MFINQLLVCILYIYIRECNSFAQWFVKDYCDRPLVVGEVIMNYEVVQSNDRVIQVYRDEEQVDNLSIYQPGETLIIKLSDTTGQYVFETSKGEFAHGGCNNKRFTSSKIKNAQLTLPDDNNDNIEIWAGWATDHGEVSITDKFILTGSNSQNEHGLSKDAPVDTEDQNNTHNHNISIHFNDSIEVLSQIRSGRNHNNEIPLDIQPQSHELEDKPKRRKSNEWKIKKGIELVDDEKNKNLRGNENKHSKISSNNTLFYVLLSCVVIYALYIIALQLKHRIYKIFYGTKSNL